MIAALKFVHVAALACWCAGLIALPLLMWKHRHTTDQSDYARFRLITHLGYIGAVTPAALITIIAGTGLIFAAQVFQPWLLVKLACVAAMVITHVWLGHLVQRSGEEKRSNWSAAPMAGLLMILPLIAIILTLVLSKPDLGWLGQLIPDRYLLPRPSVS